MFLDSLARVLDSRELFFGSWHMFWILGSVLSLRVLVGPTLGEKST